ncbi:MAG: N-acetylmuramoyl-L-alanine amidase, partial [Clostridia bacterium]|nr:N-acetylmuramoyl-L-alanine amidase [Clostridia bacterium]
MFKRIILLFSLLLMLTSCQKQTFSGDSVVTLPDTPPETAKAIETEDTDPVTAEDTEPTVIRELEGRIICIDPGHGNFTQGYKEPIGPDSSETKAAFVSGTSGAYQTEAEFNLKLSYLLKDMLEEKGAVVYMTRTDENATLSNIGRAEYANELSSDMVVRIHADGSENTEAKGISVLIPGENQFVTDSYILNSSERAGNYVLDALIRSTRAENKGIVKRYDLTGFNWTKVPCILVECG